tara:strand:- start:178 stop:375 length:198 start_codon:yes stop_codon:yes gene_type:complete
MMFFKKYFNIKFNQPLNKVHSLPQISEIADIDIQELQEIYNLGILEGQTKQFGLNRVYCYAFFYD